MTLDGFISRRQLIVGLTTATLAYSFSACRKIGRVPLAEQLAYSGDEFTFALIADPQLDAATTSNTIHKTSQRKFSKIVNEINQISDSLRFVVIDGDMVENAKDDEIKNFLDRAEQLQPPAVLVHGNHDGLYPYREFKQMQRHLNQTEEVRFSFDVGQWHFVSFPCNMRDKKYAAETLIWLDRDLQSHQARPTMVFEHYHLMPQGLTHLEWYTYERSYKHKLIDILAKYGNVRYVICGHVHNGIKTSIKTAWTYQGIHFITAPTCTASRSFGEEYPQFAAGLPHSTKSGQDTGGGYYLLIDIKGDQAQIRGRLVGVTAEYLYPNQFKPYQKNEDPLWLRRLAGYPANPNLLNPSFDSGLEGWLQPYRYLADTEPGYVAKSMLPPDDPDPNRRAAFLYCREKGQVWAGDEVMEIFQLVQLPAGKAPVFTIHYYPGMLLNGGGYIRICTYQNERLSFLMLFDWGDAGRGQGQLVAQNAAYVSTGKQAGPKALSRLGKNKRGFFWQLPADVGQWHTLQVNLQQLYDQALQTDAFANLKVNKLLITIGVWCLRDKGSHSGALFDDLALDFNTDQPSQINGTTIQIDQTVFQPGFARNPQEITG